MSIPLSEFLTKLKYSQRYIKTKEERDEFFKEILMFHNYSEAGGFHTYGEAVGENLILAIVFLLVIIYLANENTEKEKSETEDMTSSSSVVISSSSMQETPIKY